LPTGGALFQQRRPAAQQIVRQHGARVDQAVGATLPVQARQQRRPAGDDELRGHLHRKRCVAGRGFRRGQAGVQEAAQLIAQPWGPRWAG
jgi:hypothetical protein